MKASSRSQTYSRANGALPRLGRSLSLVLAFCCFSQVGQTESPAKDVDWNELELRLERIKRREHSLRRSLDRGRSKMVQLNQRVIARGRAYYRASRGLPGGDFMEHAVRVERLRQGLLSDWSRLEELRAAKKKNDRKLMLLTERRAPLELEQRAAGQARDALLSRQERERAFQLAFSSTNANSNHTAVYSAGTQLDLAGTKFASLRGRLPFPLPGRAEIEVVRLPYAEGPGLILRGAIGTPARAVFGGRVAFASEYAKYGRTVIVDHGDDYFTVTAGLQKIDVRVGDDIPQSARIGIAGTSGPGSKIYFEIRRKNENLSPDEWLGI